MAVEFMTEGLEGQRSLRLWRNMYPKFLDVDTLSMTVSKFQEFCDRNSRVMWCFQAIQVRDHAYISHTLRTLPDINSTILPLFLSESLLEPSLRRVVLGAQDEIVQEGSGRSRCGGLEVNV